MTEPETARTAELYTVSAGGFSASADAFCREDENEYLWFLSMLGPQTSLRAIAASLMKHNPDPAHISGGQPDQPGFMDYRKCLLPPRSTGTWTTRMARLPESRSWHMLLYTRMSEHSFDSNEFLLLARDPREAPGLHRAFLDRRTHLPIHESWDRWLWQLGTATGTVQPLQSQGIWGYLCNPDQEALGRALQAAIAAGTLEVPPEEERQ